MPRNTRGRRREAVLTLSGGGFRATLFHLGGLVRLNELGWLKKLDCVTGVSGGAITAAFLGMRTGEERSLFVGPFIEIDVAPDGSAVAFCLGRGHMAMGLAVLQLEPSSDGLPHAVGEPRYVVETTGTWHVHNGGWSADSRQIVYTRDMDYGDIYELVERQEPR